MGGIGIGMTFRQPTPAAGGGETPWYLAGGESAENCIAAYQAKGAASYAASKINLAHPGTHDLMDGIAPIWNTEAGWDFTGSDPYLVSDIIGETIGYRNSSILVRMTNISTSPEDGFLFNSWGENNTPRVQSTLPPCTKSSVHPVRLLFASGPQIVSSAGMHGRQ